MPKGTSSWQIASAQPSMAHFDAQYIEFAGCPMNAASLDTMRMRPARCARNVGSMRLPGAVVSEMAFTL